MSMLLLLTLNDAVTLALQHNRLVKNSALEAQKYDFQVNTARSRRKPQFQFSMLGGELLQPFDFTIPKGSLGTFAGTGPIPSTNAKIHTPAVFTTYLTGSIDQPLTQQYKIGLGIHATELDATSPVKMYAPSARKSLRKSEAHIFILSRPRRASMRRGRRSRHSKKQSESPRSTRLKRKRCGAMYWMSRPA